MTPSLSVALPSIHSSITTTDTTTNITKKPHTKPTNQKCLLKKTNRHHTRTSSVPSILPSFKSSSLSSNTNKKLSMDILLDAIDLDQQMRQFFRSEVVKSKDRLSAFNPSMMARRRSKSAPGAPPSYHHQRAFSARWLTSKNHSVTSHTEAQQVAKLIVQQHFEAVKNR